MNAIKGTRYRGLALLCVLTIILGTGTSLRADEGAVLRGVRVGKHVGFERLVFDMQGASPLGVSAPGNGTVMIKYGKLQSRVASARLSSGLPGAVSSITLSPGEAESKLTVQLHDQNARVKHSMEKGSKGTYKIILDIHAASDSGVAAEKGKDKQGVEPEPKEGKEQAKLAVQPAEVAGKEAPFGVTKLEEVYAAADRFFSEHEHELKQFGPQVIEMYRVALKAGTLAQHSPLALYRCGLSYLAADDSKRADEFLRRFIADYPFHPLIGQAWMGLGEAHLSRKSYMEAVQAYRSALNHPLEKGRLAEAHYFLAKALARLDARAEAIESLNKCLELFPSFHLVKPDILRDLGELHFAEQHYDLSSEYLFRYINIKQDIPDRDLLLAKLAETLLYRNENQLANKLYAYIDKTYPNSEGHIISKIRRAQYLEQQGEGRGERAAAVYEELHKKPLSPQLSSLVAFKLAEWERQRGNLDRSLDLVDQTLQLSADPSSAREFLKLREQIVMDTIFKAHSEGDHPRAIQLYEENIPGFQTPVPPELALIVADSYAALRLHPKAVEMYQKALSGPGHKNEEGLLKLANCYYSMTDLESAANICRQIKSEAFEERKNRLLSEIFFAQKKYKEAVVQFAKYLRQEADFDRADAEDALSYAESLAHEGKHADALAVLKMASKAVGIDEGETRTQVALLESKCFQSLNQPDKAMESLEQALANSQSEAWKDQIKYQLSALYLSAGKPEKASEKLSELMGSSQAFWKAAAQQQIGYMQMQQGAGANKAN